MGRGGEGGRDDAVGLFVNCPTSLIILFFYKSHKVCFENCYIKYYKCIEY